jgi:hypothetical protein
MPCATTRVRPILFFVLGLSPSHCVATRPWRHGKPGRTMTDLPAPFYTGVYFPRPSSPAQGSALIAVPAAIGRSTPNSVHGTSLQDVRTDATRGAAVGQRRPPLNAGAAHRWTTRGLSMQSPHVAFAIRRDHCASRASDASTGRTLGCRNGLAGA